MFKFHKSVVVVSPLYESASTRGVATMVPGRYSDGSGYLFAVSLIKLGDSLLRHLCVGLPKASLAIKLAFVNNRTSIRFALFKWCTTIMDKSIRTSNTSTIHSIASIDIFRHTPCTLLPQQRYLVQLENEAMIPSKRHYMLLLSFTIPVLFFYNLYLNKKMFYRIMHLISLNFCLTSQRDKYEVK